MAAKKKLKESKMQQKARSLKEMYLSAGIELRDFNTKMSKVKQFLASGHPVKISVLAKKFTKKNRFKNGIRRDRMAGESLENCAIYTKKSQVV